MYKILTKRELNPTVTLMEIQAPMVSKKAKAGQFVILRSHDDSERIPLTVADYDSSVTILDVATALNDWGYTGITQISLGGILTGAAEDVIITADENIV